MTRVPGARLLLALVAGLGLLVSPSGATGQGPAAPGDSIAYSRFREFGFEEILMEFRVGRLTRHTVWAFSDGDVALLPASALFAIAELEHGFDDTDALWAVVRPAGRTVLIRPDSATATLDGEPVPVRDGWIIPDGAAEVFVAHPVLETLLGVDIRVDWAELTAIVIDPMTLPVGQRIARETRWNRIRGGPTRRADVPRLELDNRPLGGAVLDWGVSSNVGDPVQTATYSAGLAARVLDGSLRISARSLGPAFQSRSRVDATYQYVFQDRLWITQARLGDGFTTGPRFRDVRGFSLTNAPFLRGSFFGTDTFTGQVGPGWDVELRRSGQVLDLTRADEQGAFALDIPLSYGENAVQVVAFGPHGEVVTTDRLLLLNRDRIPSGRLEWGLSGGQCRSMLCQATGNLDLRYGINDRWTVRGGTEAFHRDTLESFVQPYLGVSGLVAQSVELSAEALLSGHLRAGATFTPVPWFRLRGAHTVFSGRIEDPVLHDGRRLNTTEGDLFFQPSRTRSRLYLRGALLRQVLRTGVNTRYQASISIPLGTMGVETGLRMETGSPSEGASLSRNFQFATVSGTAPFQRRNPVWIRGEVEVADLSVLERVRAQVSQQVTQGVRFDIGASWHRVTGAQLNLGFTALLSGLRNITQFVTREGTSAQLTQYSNGTVHWDEATEQVSFAPGPGIERGGISGYVFRDDNGNGIRDADEPGLPGVRVVVGGRAVRTDAQGRHSSWDLVPFEPVEIWTDSTSIPDPTLVPVRNQISVMVPPSSFGRVDLAVSPSREIAGRVVRLLDGNEVLIPYAQIELVDLDSGESQEIRTFSDGEFYLAGVRPGRYALRLSPRYAVQTGLDLAEGPVTLEVPAGSGLDVIGPVVVRLAPSGDDSPSDSQGGIR
jgi:hypothetical protein